MRYTIRKARTKDVKELAKLYFQFWQLHFKFDPLLKPARSYSPAVAKKDALKDIRKKNRYIFIAAINEKVLGFIELRINKNDQFFKARKYGYINAAFVAKEARKQGITKALTKTAIKFFQKNKLSYVKTNVYVKNEIAMRAWTKLGFKPLSEDLIKNI